MVFGGCINVLQTSRRYKNIEKSHNSGQMNPEVKFCGECGVPLVASERFCGKCGAEVMGL